jgi:teichuronic acid biosynthesis glycosyltransferase TuaC
MKVLVIGSGNHAGHFSPIVENQAGSLREAGVEISLFFVNGRGMRGYLRNIIPLRRVLRKKEFDVVHAHYSFSGMLASLSGARPLVVSLMGESEGEKPVIRLFIRLFSRLSWKITITKSEKMNSALKLRKALVIPNGVDLGIFHPMDKNESKRKLGWDPEKLHILFAGNPERPIKNFGLARSAIEILDLPEIDLHTLGRIGYGDMPVWINASDLVIMSSHSEGSPNVIKEAMACNCPLVSTDVGDIRWLAGEVQGCYIAGNTPAEYALVLNQALTFAREKIYTAGRERLLELKLGTELIAEKLISVYTEVCGEDMYKS